VQEGFCDTLVSVVLSLFWARDLHEVRDCNDRPSHDAWSRAALGSTVATWWSNRSSSRRAWLGVWFCSAATMMARSATSFQRRLLSSVRNRANVLRIAPRRAATRSSTVSVQRHVRHSEPSCAACVPARSAISAPST